MKTFKELFEKLQGGKQVKEDMPEIYVHYANLCQLVINSKELNDRFVATDAINWFKLNNQKFFYKGPAYRTTYLSNEKVFDFYTHGKIVLGLMPYYSFSLNPNKASDFSTSNRNNAFIKKNIVGLKSYDALTYLSEILNKDLENRGIKDFDIAHGDVVELESFLREKNVFNVNGKNFKKFFQATLNFNDFGDAFYFESEEEVLVVGPVFLEKKDFININLQDSWWFNSSGNNLEHFKKSKKELDFIIKMLFPPARVDEVKKYIKDILRKDGNFVGITTSDGNVSYRDRDKILICLNFETRIKGKNNWEEVETHSISLLSSGKISMKKDSDSW